MNRCKDCQIVMPSDCTRCDDCAQAAAELDEYMGYDLEDPREYEPESDPKKYR